MSPDEFVSRIWNARCSLMRLRAVELADAVVHISREDWMNVRREKLRWQGDLDPYNATVLGLPFKPDDKLQPGRIVLRWEVDA